MRRYIREANAWNSHLTNTKTFILKSAANKTKNKVAVLGSGWLLDVPLVELSEMFAQVHLFDISHPVQTKQKVKKYPHIKLIETDISGFASSFYNFIRDYKKHPTPQELKNISPQFDFDLSDFDFVISCNILNQLDIILVDYIKKFYAIEPSIETEIRKLIQDTHINLLPKGKSCLISDTEELSIDKHDQIHDRKNLIFTDKLSIPLDKWEWHFDNHYSYNPNFKTRFRVVATDI